jgi:hypothetical protein
MPSDFQTFFLLVFDDPKIVYITMTLYFVYFCTLSKYDNRMKSNSLTRCTVLRRIGWSWK